MDCDFIERNELHEQFLFNRLSDTSRRAYEQHIADCPACRGRLEIERKVISGIRESGRRQMKTEIRQQVAERKSPLRLGWSIPVKVAAAVLILVMSPGLYVIYRNHLSDQAPAILDGARYEQQAQKEAEEGLDSARPSVRTERPRPVSEMSADRDANKRMPASEGTMTAREMPAELLPTDQTAGLGRASRQTSGLKTEADDRQDRSDEVMPAANEEKANLPGEPDLADALRHGHDAARLEKNAESAQVGTRTSGGIASSPAGAVLATAPADTSLTFVLAGQNISLRLQRVTVDVSAYRGPTGSQELQKEFPVQILSRDSVALHLLCLVDEPFLQQDLRQLRLEWLDNNTLRLRAASQETYLIDLRSTAAMARQEQ
jgi:hypothetical protein